MKIQEIIDTLAVTGKIIVPVKYLDVRFTELLELYMKSEDVIKKQNDEILELKKERVVQRERKCYDIKLMVIRLKKEKSDLHFENIELDRLLLAEKAKSKNIENKTFIIAVGGLFTTINRIISVYFFG